MRTKLLSLAAILMAATLISSTAYAQFGGLAGKVPKASVAKKYLEHIAAHCNKVRDGVGVCATQAQADKANSLRGKAAENCDFGYPAELNATANTKCKSVIGRTPPRFIAGTPPSVTPPTKVVTPSKVTPPTKVTPRPPQKAAPPASPTPPEPPASQPAPPASMPAPPASMPAPVAHVCPPCPACPSFWKMVRCWWGLFVFLCLLIGGGTALGYFIGLRNRRL